MKKLLAAELIFKYWPSREEALPGARCSVGTSGQVQSTQIEDCLQDSSTGSSTEQNSRQEGASGKNLNVYEISSCICR
ncbi:unnamed protein product [Calypogeia fissa]